MPLMTTITVLQALQLAMTLARDASPDILKAMSFAVEMYLAVSQQASPEVLQAIEDGRFDEINFKAIRMASAEELRRQEETRLRAPSVPAAPDRTPRPQ